MTSFRNKKAEKIPIKKRNIRNLFSCDGVVMTLNLRYN